MKIIYRTILALALAGSGFAAQPIESLTEQQKAATRTALGLGTAATADILPAADGPPRTVIVHDDCTGIVTTMADNGTRAAMPGPGTMTAQNLREHTLCRYQGGELWLSHLGTNVVSNAVHWGGVPAAVGLTMVVRALPDVKPGISGNFIIGFSNSPNGGTGHGAIAVQGLTTETQLNVGITRANSVITSTYPADTLPTEVGLSELYPMVGVVEPGEEIAVCVHYKSLTHQQYFMQGGRTASLGCDIGSDKWFQIGDTYMDLTGLTVYPFIQFQYEGVHRVRDVQVLSQWSPSEKNKLLEQSRQKEGIHVPYLQVDPVSGLMVAAWNSGWEHYGEDALIDIKYSTRLASGTWTDAAILLPWPNSGDIGNQVCHLSVVNGKLWLVYITVDWAATAIEGGGLKRREVTLNSTTGAATLGAEVSLGFGTQAISFSEIVQTATGRYLLPYQEAQGANGTAKPRIAYSDDNGTTWATVAVGTGTNPDSLTYLAEQTLTLEASGAVGCYLRAGGGAYYARSIDDGVTWTQPAARTEFPMPTGFGTRLNARNLSGGSGALLIGSEHRGQRRNVKIWKVDTDGNVVWSKPFFDAMGPNADTTADNTNQSYRSSQYPNLCVDSGGGIAVIYAHQHGSNTPNSSFLMGVRVAEFADFTNQIPPEITGLGNTLKREFPHYRETRRAVGIAYSTTPTPNMSQAALHYITLTASTAVVAAPTNALPWDEITMVFIQGGAGSFTATFNAIYEFGGITPTWLTEVGATNTLKAYYNHRTNKWVVTGWN